MDTMYHTYVVTDKSGDSVTFNILNSVVKNKDAPSLLDVNSAHACPVL